MSASLSTCKMAKKIKSGTLPQTISLEPGLQKEFNKTVKEIKDNTKGTSGLTGVIYIGHVPHGFFEEQMRQFFSQFGHVNRVRIARSKKTGNIKGYAFVEFLYDEVADIVAETMNNYLMFNKLLKCEHIPADKVHPDMFKGAGRKFMKPKAHKVAITRYNNMVSLEKQKQIIPKITRKNAKKMAKLKELGIDYRFDGVKIEKKKLKLSKGADDGKPLNDTVTVTDEVPMEKIQVLYDDESEDEITFKTPPQTVRTPKPNKSEKSLRKTKGDSGSLIKKTLRKRKIQN
ncbi:unnamed protein product [Owenia fusiformis]|uniref:Uncharacterized protein n=1 Tax=Owenia fusiformis TaxID=6347 RepID=A0A8J1XZG1_OWEFU|nr:unnamed protein product [Owenia fusiformis]